MRRVDTNTRQDYRRRRRVRRSPSTARRTLPYRVFHRVRGGRPAARLPAGVARPQLAVVHLDPAREQLHRPAVARHGVGPAVCAETRLRRAGLAVRAAGASIVGPTVAATAAAQILLSHLGENPAEMPGRAGVAADSARGAIREHARGRMAPSSRSCLPRGCAGGLGCRASRRC